MGDATTAGALVLAFLAEGDASQRQALQDLAAVGCFDIGGPADFFTDGVLSLRLGRHPHRSTDTPGVADH
ncbi:hypothetical protein ACFRJ1_09460 [Streptomyces sp. NPDC056773]|uniref:hypothetical protein n=1 Tax=unclassified Streptomyces TaxID=2593676 RepID=UPI00369937A1